MLVKVVKVVGHPLHLVAVVVDAQIPLYEEPKLGVKVEDASHTVADELLEGNSELLSSVVVVASGLLEVNGDGAEQRR
jgi:hypothetical protein